MRRETATSLINDSNNEQAGELLTNERGPELVPRFFNEPTPRMLTRHVSSTAVTASRSTDAKLCIRSRNNPRPAAKREDKRGGRFSGPSIVLLRRFRSMLQLFPAKIDLASWKFDDETNGEKKWIDVVKIYSTCSFFVEISLVFRQLSVYDILWR